MSCYELIYCGCKKGGHPKNVTFQKKNSFRFLYINTNLSMVYYIIACFLHIKPIKGLIRIIIAVD